ncbi:MAG: DUF2764 family protein [Kiritimatiellia bacterium]
MSLAYLISSLPAIDFESEPPLSCEDFEERCAEWLNAAECRAVSALLAGKTSDHPFVVAWLDKETILRNALAQARARTKGVDATLYTRYAHGCDKKIESDVEDAMQHNNALRKERNIDKIRWETAEELQGYDPLSIRTVFAYAIKLAIVTRWGRRDKESGKQTFDEITEIPIEL